MKISISGKGGTGKSVMATLLARAFEEAGYSVLVVDSDESNPGLYRNFGLSDSPKPLMDMFGGEQQVSKAASRGDSIGSFNNGTNIGMADIGKEYLIRRGNIRFASIGKITSAFQGCACPMGQAAKMFLERLVLGPNEVALVDMEAGVEHFGRGVERGIDVALVVVEPSFESMALASKVTYMARAAGMKRIWAILNKIPSPEIEARLRAELASRSVETIGAVRYEPLIFESSLSGKPLRESGALDDARKVATSLIAALKDAASPRVEASQNLPDHKG